VTHPKGNCVPAAQTQFQHREVGLSRTVALASIEWAPIQKEVLNCTFVPCENKNLCIDKARQLQETGDLAKDCSQEQEKILWLACRKQSQSMGAENSVPSFCCETRKRTCNIHAKLCVVGSRSFLCTTYSSLVRWMVYVSGRV